MSYIKFNEDQMYSSRPVLNEPRGLIALIQKWGLAKDNHSAQYVLLSIVGIMVFLAIFLVMFSEGLGVPHQSRYVPGQNVLAPPQGK